MLTTSEPQQTQSGCAARDLAFSPGNNIFDVLEICFKGYLLCLLFLYPYGLVLGQINLRPPDLFALALVGLTAIVLATTSKLIARPVLFWPIWILLSFEVLLPFLAVVGGYAGVGGGVGNGLRIFLVWAPVLTLAVLLPEERVRRMDQSVHKILRVTLVCNLLYGLLQVLARAGLVSQKVLITRLLEPWAVDSYFRVSDGFRASGFFTNTSGLSIFGTCCLAYFLAKYLSLRRTSDLVFAGFSIAVIGITMSRAAAAGMIVVLTLAWLLLPNRSKFYVALVLTALVGTIAWLLERSIGLDVIWSRYQVYVELGAAGLVEDSSFSARLFEIWPLALEAAREFPLGTMAQAVSLVGLIDSGYITYYIQGGWIFLAALLFMYVGLAVISWSALRERTWPGLMVLFLFIYLLGTMIVLPPLKNAVFVFFLAYSLWLTDVHTRSRIARFSWVGDVCGRARK